MCQPKTSNPQFYRCFLCHVERTKKHPFGNCLYHLFMVHDRGMLYPHQQLPGSRRCKFGWNLTLWSRFWLNPIESCLDSPIIIPITGLKIMDFPIESLVGGFNPSEKYESVGMSIINIWKNKIHFPNHHPVMNHWFSQTANVGAMEAFQSAPAKSGSSGRWDSPEHNHCHAHHTHGWRPHIQYVDNIAITIQVYTIEYLLHVIRCRVQSNVIE